MSRLDEAIADVGYILDALKCYRSIVKSGSCTPTNSNDPVNHPAHYTQGGIECIDAMVAAFGKEAVRTYCHINAFKYLWRSDFKGKTEDISKAIWYLNKYKELNT